MTPLRKAYLDELVRIQERIHQLYDQALLSSGYATEGSQPGTWLPSIDLIETDQAYMLSAELCGVAREDVDLSVDGRRVELTGRRHLPGEGHNFLRMERSYGPFRRVFELGAEVDSERTVAHLEQGVLEIYLPKKVARELEVTAEEETG